MKAKNVFEMNINRFHQFHEESVSKYKQWLKKREDMANVDTFKKDTDAKKKNELNMDMDYWKKKFLYPFALDTGPLKLTDGGSATDLA